MNVKITRKLGGKRFEELNLGDYFLLDGVLYIVAQPKISTPLGCAIELRTGKMIEREEIINVIVNPVDNVEISYEV